MFLAISKVKMGGGTPPLPKYTSLIYVHFDMRKGAPRSRGGLVWVLSFC